MYDCRTPLYARLLGCFLCCRRTCQAVVVASALVFLAVSGSAWAQSVSPNSGGNVYAGGSQSFQLSGMTGYTKVQVYDPRTIFGGNQFISLNGDSQTVNLNVSGAAGDSGNLYFYLFIGNSLQGVLYTGAWSVVANPLPTASFTLSPQTGTAPLPVIATFTGSGATSVSWSWGDGSPGSSGTVAPHTYNNVGTYVVTSTATNSAGSASATKTVTVTAPIASPPNVAAGTAHVVVTVAHTGAAQPAYNITLVGNGRTFSGSTDTSGKFTVDVPGGITYLISAWGTSNTSPPKADSSQKSEYLPGGQTDSVNFNFLDDGTENGGQTGSEASNGLLGGLQKVVTDALKTATDNIKQGIQDTLTYLFVPSAGLTQDLLTDVNQLANWGPGSIVVQLNTALGTAATTAPSLTMPGYDGHVFTPGGGQAINPGQYMPAGLRATLGAGTFLVGAFLMLRRFAPRMVVS